MAVFWKEDIMKVLGIHHVSSIVGHAQRNLDFYASVLGMRLVKKTLNFDDSSTYHFYFGNEDASTPVLTTFPWTDAKKGHRGSGYVELTSLGVNPGSLDYWEKRLESFDVETYRYTRFNRERLAFTDPDNLEIELIENKDGPLNTWEYNGIESKDAIKGIDNAILSSRSPMATHKLLTKVLGLNLTDEDEETYLFSGSNAFGKTVELQKNYQEIGKQGVGTVHHIAFMIENGSEEAWLKHLFDSGYHPTEIKDRKYFKSIYFREKGGILIELATEGPGFTVDESVEELGTTLLIPPHFTHLKENIEQVIMPVSEREINKLQGYGYRNKYEFDLLQKKEAIKHEILTLKKKEHDETLSDEERKELQELKEQLRNVK